MARQQGYQESGQMEICEFCGKPLRGLYQQQQQQQKQQQQQQQMQQDYDGPRCVNCGRRPSRYYAR